MARAKKPQSLATPEKGSDEAILEEARKRYKAGLEADQDDRQTAEEVLRFAWNADGCQWDDEAKKLRKNRPMLTENPLPSMVRQAVNDIRRSRPQGLVLPVDDSSDPYTAQILEGLIRNIEASSRADLAYDNAVQFAAYCGRGYWKITTEYVDGTFDQDIAIKPVRSPFSIVDDPSCQQPDKSDRMWAIETEWVPNADFSAKWGEEPTPFDEAAGTLGDHTPLWFQHEKTLVANYWRIRIERETLHLMSDGEVTKDPAQYVAQWTAQHALVASAIAAQAQAAGMVAPAPAMQPPVSTKTRESELRVVEWFTCTGTKVYRRGSWAGQFIPLVFVGGEQISIGEKAHTKGMAHDAVDLVKANNYLLSTQIENIALTPKVPFIGPKGAFDEDAHKWGTVNQESHAFIQYKGTVAPSRPDQVSGQPELAQVRAGVKDGIRTVVGLMGASLGDRGPETAWRAITARQKEGDTAVFHLMDNLVRAVRYSSIVIIDLAGKVYDSTRALRILNPDNQPVIVTIKQNFVDEKTGQTRSIDFASGKYDVAVTAGPAFETQRQETAAAMVDLSARHPRLMEVAGDLVIKSIAPAESDKIAERLRRSMPKALLGEGPSPEEQQLQQQLQAMQQQLQEAGANLNFLQSELAKQSSDLAGKQVDYFKKQAELEAAVRKAQADKERAELEVRRKEIELIEAMQQASGTSEQQKLAGEKLMLNVQRLLAAHDEHVKGLVGAGEAVAPAAMPGAITQPVDDGGGPVGGYAEVMAAVAQSQAELREAIAALARATLAPRQSQVSLPDGRVVNSVSTVMGGA